MSEVGQINVEPLSAGKATPKSQAAAEQAAKTIVRIIQDAGGDSEKALDVLAGSKDDIEEGTGKNPSTGSETTTADVATPEDSTLAEREEYSYCCNAVRDAAENYDRVRRTKDLRSQKENLDNLAKLWQGLDLKFDEHNLKVTLQMINDLNSIADEAYYLVNSVQFFDEFEAQRRDIINNNFDQLKRVYLETSDPTLKTEIYDAFLDHITQSPSGEANRELEFCLEHFEADFTDRRQIDIMLDLLSQLLANKSFSKEFAIDDSELNKLQDLAFEKITQLLDAESSAITDWDKEELVRTLAIVYTDRRWTPQRDKAQDYLDEKIEKLGFGIDRTNLFVAWRRTATSKDDVEKPAMMSQEDFIVNNIMAIFALERARPGICKILFDEFKIRDFERYPQEVLVAQYDNRNKDMPYGVIVAARGDHNGALSSVNDYVREKLYTDLAALGYGLRIYEVDGRGILRMLRKAAKRYGSQNKISFALIQQHGQEDAIGADDDDSLWWAIRTQHVRKALQHIDNRRIREARDWFVENPTLILDSCSTAPIGTMFKDFGFNIIAPQIPTKLNRLDIIQADTDGEIKFIGEYRDKGAAVHVANPHTV